MSDKRKEPGNWNHPYVPFWYVLADGAAPDSDRIRALAGLLKASLGKSCVLDFAAPTVPARPTDTGKTFHTFKEGVSA